jgi:hypothetical protein
MGGVVASALEHCEMQPWACIRSDADFGSGAGTGERRQAAARRLVVTLPLRLRAYCLRCERYRPRPWGEQASLARIVRSACGRDKPVHGLGATIPARLRRASDDRRSTRVRRVERPEHAADFRARVIRGDRDLHRSWLSVPGPSAPPVWGGSVRGFWLEQAHADQPTVVIDALNEVSVQFEL